MKSRFLKAVIFAFVLALPGAVAAQKAGSKTVKKTDTPPPVAQATPTPAAISAGPAKRNERPSDPSNAKMNTTDGANKTAAVSNSTVYSYEFDRPGFTYPNIRIEHDDNGKGKISFKRDGAEEYLTDPIQLTAVTLENLRTAFTALNFLDSTENYQYVKDFSNMGNVTITLKRDGRTRVAKYNWTENKDAKTLYEEYRRIGNEYIWKFEIVIGRENQPLQTPGLMDEMDSYLQRNEISDPPHLVPLLTELSTDERLPLIARNHAAKLIKQIEKIKK
ncbi:MAG TPA: hypothetical protein VHQ01_08150 [Pyrinomonadaceae bacterium]|jgi:hypothetical protein|nr:hypothetical protein [Pyrinomonadaceae bacterium]